MPFSKHNQAYKLYRRNAKLRRRARIRAWFAEYKKSRGPCPCGEGTAACLDFHHRDRLTKDLAGMSAAAVRGWSINRLLLELKKCDLICANCHRKEHGRDWYKGLAMVTPGRGPNLVRRYNETRAWLKSYKESFGPCPCGEADLRCLDFHHRDPKIKTCQAFECVDRGWSIARIMTEIAKCDLICANCHRKEHASVA